MRAGLRLALESQLAHRIQHRLNFVDTLLKHRGLFALLPLFRTLIEVLLHLFDGTFDQFASRTQ